MNPLELWATDIISENIPFVQKGRDRKGIDCWGLICLAYKEVYNLELPHYTETYDTTKDFKKLAKTFSKHKDEWVEIEPGKELEGDCILLNVRNRPIHVGIITKKGYMLHIEENIDACVESYKTFQWKNRIVGIYRHPNHST